MSTLAHSTISSDGPGAHRQKQHDDRLPLDSKDPSSLAIPFYEPPQQPSASDEQDSPAQAPTPAANPKRRPTALNRTASPRDGAVTAKDIKTPVRASWGPAPNVSTPPSAAIDPLSQHILMRTNTENASSPRLRYSARPDSPGPDVLQRLGSDSASKHSVAAPVDVVKDKRKGASFLSRLSMRGRKNLRDDDLFDDGSEIGEPRPSGSDARVFSSSIGAGGYLPHHKEPPRYIKVRAHNKKNREFNRIFLAQQLSTRPSAPAHDDDKSPPSNGGAIWAMEFSKDGRYLAAAGKDRIVRVWSVISTAEERRQHEEEESADRANDERLSAPVFRSKPYREFIGHCGEVLDLSWSKNNFLLSSSMDKTVRLWHLSRPECLCTFKHKDFVTSIAFHPTDDRFFLAGSLDGHLRLWSIPDKSVAFTAQLPDLVTAVAFCPDGKIVIGGVLSGMCLFYETEGLKLLSQMPVRSSRGKNAKGSKITGIKTMAFPPGSAEGEVKILVTSNDSRIRLYRLKDRSLEVKFKGHQNDCSQVHASFSDDARHIICGSEDKRAFLWSLHPDDPDTQEKTPCEFFDAHPARVSATAMAPTKTRQLLSASGDPLYDLCNPPPVKLVSLEETFTTGQPTGNDSQDQAQAPSSNSPKESPAYLEKSKHPDGNIIVTADQDGLIKVFRQDCAFVKRRHEVWETGSNFSKKLVGQGTLLGRSGSIITRTSASSHPRSRRTSLSQPALNAGTQGSHMSSDRINSWRYGIDSGRNSHRNSVIGAASIRSERSMSPSRLGALPASTDLLGTGAVSGDQKKPPPPSLGDSLRIGKRSDAHENSSQPPTPNFSFRPVAEDEEPKTDGAGSNYSFWNLNRWRGISSIRPSNLSPTPGLITPRTVSTPATLQTSSQNPTNDQLSPKKETTGPQIETSQFDGDNDEVVSASADDARQPELLQPEDCDPYAHGRRGERLQSVVSRLSVEYTSDEDNSNTRVCDKCGSRDFKRRQMAGSVRLLCSNCGKVVEDDL